MIPLVALDKADGNAIHEIFKEDSDVELMVSLTSGGMLECVACSDDDGGRYRVESVERGLGE